MNNTNTNTNTNITTATTIISIFTSNSTPLLTTTTPTSTTTTMNNNNTTMNTTTSITTTTLTDSTSSSYYYYYYDYDGDEDSRRGAESYKAGLAVYWWMLAVVVLPLCVAGLFSNAASVLAWRRHRNADNAVVLLFQCLGLADGGFLLLSLVRGVLHCSSSGPGVTALGEESSSETSETYFVAAIFCFQALSVNLTAVVGALRWVAVTFPFNHHHHTSSYRNANGGGASGGRGGSGGGGGGGSGCCSWSRRRRRVLVVVAAVSAWCLLLSGLMAGLKIGGGGCDSGAGQMAGVVGLQVVGLVLPTLVLMVFSALLLATLCRLPRQRSKKKRRMTTVVVLGIALCSFLACPVGVTSHVLPCLVHHRSQDGCSWTCVFAALGAGDLFQVLNASVNFLFYFFFASRFRPLLREALCCCSERLSGRRGSHRKSSTSSGQFQHTSECGTRSDSLRHHDRDRIQLSAGSPKWSKAAPPEQRPEDPTLTQDDPELNAHDTEQRSEDPKHNANDAEQKATDAEQNANDAEQNANNAEQNATDTAKQNKGKPKRNADDSNMHTEGEGEGGGLKQHQEEQQHRNDPRGHAEQDPLGLTPGGHPSLMKTDEEPRPTGCASVLQHEDNEGEPAASLQQAEGNSNSSRISSHCVAAELSV